MPQMSLEEALELALQHHQAGRLAEAEMLYRQILQQRPEQPDALHFLGLLAHQVGKQEAALELMRRAAEINPHAPHFHSNLANVWRAVGRPEEAVACCKWALELQPNSAEAQTNLGLALQEQGKSDEAIACYLKSLQIAPASAPTHNNLGVALQSLGKLDEAEAAYQQAIALQADYADAHANLGSLKLRQNRPEEAIEACYRALAQSPDHPTLRINLGAALKAAHRSIEAEARYRRVLARQPGNAHAWTNLADALVDQGRKQEAMECFRQAAFYGGAAEHSNLLFLMSYDAETTPEQQHAEAQRWWQRFGAPLAKGIRPHASGRDPQRRLRVAYVSPSFRAHAMTVFLEPVLQHHDHQQFEVYCYSDTAEPDAVTARLKRYADQWREIRSLSDSGVAERIREDGIDILVDLSGHSAGNRLPVLARKPAPVQVSYLEFPPTTGLQTIDYKLTDAVADPPGEERFYQEKLLRLPGCAWCYRPPEQTPQPNELPALKAGRVTFGCLNKSAKVGEAALRLFAQVLRRVPDSRLVLLCDGDEHERRRARESIEQCGLDGRRVEVEGRRVQAEYLRLLHRIDIALDPVPYNGHTTTCDALWMGVPVVTLRGGRHVSRVGASLLSAVGLDDLVARDEQEYVRLAAELAGDPARLIELRRTLRNRMRGSLLTDGARFTRSVEAAYRRMWRAWCQSPRT